MFKFDLALSASSEKFRCTTWTKRETYFEISTSRTTNIRVERPQRRHPPTAQAKPVLNEPSMYVGCQRTWPQGEEFTKLASRDLFGCDTCRMVPFICRLFSIGLAPLPLVRNLQWFGTRDSGLFFV